MKDKIVSVRFAEQDIKTLRKQADMMRVSISALVRLTLAEILEKGGSNSGTQCPDLRSGKSKKEGGKRLYL